MPQERKKPVIRAAYIVTLLSLLLPIATSCSSDVSSYLDRITNNEAITIELAEVSSYQRDPFLNQIVEEPWVQLDRIQTSGTARSDVDKIFGIHTDLEYTGSLKSGCMYIDENGNQNGNNTLYNACMNEAFVKIWAEKYRELGYLAPSVYADVDGNGMLSALATMNFYYQLMVDVNDPDSFSPHQSLSREQFYTLLFKATNPVQDLEASSEFAEAVGGETVYTKYAEGVAKYGFLQVGNQSLDGKTIQGNMSRAEAAYTVMNMLFPSELAAFKADGVGFADAKNAGDLAKKLGFEGQNRWQSYTLLYMVQHPETGLQQELYNAVMLAKQLGIWLPPSNESRWDEPISKSEALDLLMKAFIKYAETNGYLTSDQYGVKATPAPTPAPTPSPTISPVTLEGVKVVEAPDLSGLTLGTTEYATAVASYLAEMNGKDVSEYSDLRVSNFELARIPSLSDWSNRNPLIPDWVYLLPMNSGMGTTAVDMLTNTEYVAARTKEQVNRQLTAARAMGSTYANASYRDKQAYLNNAMFFEPITYDEVESGAASFITKYMDGKVTAEGGALTDSSMVYLASNGSVRVRVLYFVKFIEATPEFLSSFAGSKILKLNTWYMNVAEYGIAAQFETGKYAYRPHSYLMNVMSETLTTLSEISEADLQKLIASMDGYIGVADLTPFAAN